jgi:hypothetical protein
MSPALIALSSDRGFFELLGGVMDWVLLGVVLIAFLVFGIRDLARLSWTRISAISSVSFQESIRRKVLWITPLAILGAVVVSQLQVAVDPQDAIRQTTKICLFATGLVVTLTGIILACTSLPKEIENRVIYTIVTKPTTRLEIVLGKVWGFAKVSAAILLIMGLFTYGYLHVRAWRLSRSVETALAGLPPDAPARDTLVHYRDHGLLNAKAMSQPTWLQVLAEPPVDGQPRWMAGGQGQQFAVLFNLGPDEASAAEAALAAGGRMSLFVDMATEVREPNAFELEVIRQTSIPMRDADQPDAGPGVGPALPGAVPAEPATQPAAPKRQLPLPVLSVGLKNQAGDAVIEPSTELNGGKPIVLPVGAPGPVEVPIDPKAVYKLFEAGRFAVYVEARSPAVRYAVGDRPVSLRVVGADGRAVATINVDQRSERPMITSLTGRYGQQIVGGAEGEGGVAVFRFDRVDLGSGSGGGSGDGGEEVVTFEVRAGIERGGDGPGDTEMLPHAQLRIRDPETGNLSAPFLFRPETNRISYIPVPRSAFPPGGGSFEALVRVLTPDQWLGMKPASVSLATGSRFFAFNLFKSTFILWLLSVLVIAIAVFCSTFLSWPIAVTLTLVLLLGRWGVEQISDASGGSLELGAQITAQSDPVTGRVVRESVDALGRMLELVATFLPDVASFQATADIERGITVSGERLARAGWVLLGYGAPVVMLAYLILKRKEVAP